jgi:hypothetical protein
MAGLPDRQAADAVRTRIDWNYLLCLDLTDPGFHHTVLSEFRAQLLAHGAQRRRFNTLLDLAQDRGSGTLWVKARGRQRSDSMHILGAMRTLARQEAVTETLRHALNILATVAPAWRRVHTTPDWVDRYGLRASEYRLPKGQAKRLVWATQTELMAVHSLVPSLATVLHLISAPCQQSKRYVRCGFRTSRFRKARWGGVTTISCQQRVAL